MVTVRLDKKYEDRLERLAEITGRSKSFFIKKAIENSIDDMEDLYLALERLENPDERLSMEEMRKCLEVED